MLRDELVDFRAVRISVSNEISRCRPSAYQPDQRDDGNRASRRRPAAARPRAGIRAIGRHVHKDPGKHGFGGVVAPDDDTRASAGEAISLILR
jgi:hypothetical protein